MWYWVRITVRCGNGVHSITVSQKAFAEIRGGKEITLQGDGFALEEGTELREVADAIQVFTEYGRHIGNWINNTFSEPPIVPVAAFPLPDKPSLPRSLDYSPDPRPL